MSMPESLATGHRDVCMPLSARLGRSVASGASLDQILRAIAEVAVDVVASSRAASFTILAGEAGPTSVATGPLAFHLDRIQYEAGSGPCVDAARRGATVLVDLRGASAYPVLGRAAVEATISHSLSVGLATKPATGGLNVYGTAVFSDEAVQATKTCVRYARIAVLADRSAVGARAEAEDGLQPLLQARLRVEQAKGILMYRDSARGVADAAAELARLAQAAQQTVSAAAATLVEDMQH